MGVVVSKHPKDFDCSQCFKEKQTQNGCYEDSPIPGRWDFNGQTYQRCPVKLVNPQIWMAIRLYQHYERGFLPVEGGILDQSNVFLQTIEIIQSTLLED